MITRVPFDWLRFRRIKKEGRASGRDLDMLVDRVENTQEFLDTFEIYTDKFNMREYETLESEINSLERTVKVLQKENARLGQELNEARKSGFL